MRTCHILQSKNSLDLSLGDPHVEDDTECIAGLCWHANRASGQQSHGELQDSLVAYVENNEARATMTAGVIQPDHRLQSAGPPAAADEVMKPDEIIKRLATRNWKTHAHNRGMVSNFGLPKHRFTDVHM